MLIDLDRALEDAQHTYADRSNSHALVLKQFGSDDPYAKDAPEVVRSGQLLEAALEDVTKAIQAKNRSVFRVRHVSPEQDLRSAALSRNWRRCFELLEPHTGSLDARDAYARSDAYIGFDRFSSVLAPDYDDLTAKILDICDRMDEAKKQADEAQKKAQKKSRRRAA